MKRHTTIRARHDDKPTFRIRPARHDDLYDMVTVDLSAFRHVYHHYGKNPAELRKELMEKFTHRLNTLGGDYIPVLTHRDKVVGFLVGCPTEKNLRDFTSWEDITDQGTLTSMYNPQGSHMYIVTLSLLPQATRWNAHKMLFAYAIAQMIRKNIQKSFFASRVPGLRSWVTQQCVKHQQSLDDLTEKEIHEYAKTYIGLSKTVNGKKTLYDPLLEIYRSAGCSISTLIPNAYSDKQSLNFALLFSYSNPVPAWLRRIHPIRRVISWVVFLIARSMFLTGRSFDHDETREDRRNDVTPPAPEARPSLPTARQPTAMSSNHTPTHKP